MPTRPVPSTTVDTVPPSPRFTTTSSCRSPPTATLSPRSAGASPTSNSVTAANPKACGSQKPQSTVVSSTSWLRKASSSPSSPQPSAPASVAYLQILLCCHPAAQRRDLLLPLPNHSLKIPGPKPLTPPLIPPIPTSSISMKAAPSPSS